MLQGKSLIKRIKQTLPPTIVNAAIELIACEGEFVTGSPAESPEDLLRDYGLDNDELKECYKIEPAPDPLDNAAALLDKCPSWGEFIGGVLASYGEWGPDEKLRIEPALLRAINTANAVGVDH